MNVKPLFFYLFLLLTFSCKNEKDIDSLEIVRPQLTDNVFKVSLKVTVKKDDDFSLYFTTDGTTDFKADPIWMSVKGSSEEQKITFSLKKEIIPTQLRLDFGMKKDQEDIILKSVVLEYNGKKREIIGAELGTYFRADDNKCTFDPATGIIKALVKDGVRQNPSLYPQEKVLNQEIDKLAK